MIGLRDLRTTICGILGFAAAGLTMVAIPLLDGDPSTTANFGAFGSAAAAAFGLILAGDSQKQK